MTEHLNLGVVPDRQSSEPILPDPAIIALHHSLKEQLPEITPLTPGDCLSAPPNSDLETLLKLTASYLAPPSLAPDGQKITPNGLSVQTCNNLLREGLTTACDDARIEAAKVNVIGLLLSDIHLRQETPESAAHIFCKELEQARNPASRQPIIYELTGYLVGAEPQWQPDDSHPEELVAFFSSVRDSNLAIQQEEYQRQMDTFETQALMEAQDTLREANSLRGEVTATNPENPMSKEAIRQHIADLKTSLMDAMNLCREVAPKAAEVSASLTHAYPASEFTSGNNSDDAYLAVHGQQWYLERSSAVSKRFLEASQNLQYASGNREQAWEIVETLLPDKTWTHDQLLLDTILSHIYNLPGDWDGRLATIKNDPLLYTHLISAAKQIFFPADVEKFLQEPSYLPSSQFVNQRRILEQKLWDLAGNNLSAYIDYQLDEETECKIYAGVSDLAGKIMLSTLPSLRSV